MNSTSIQSLVITFHNVLRCNSEFGGQDIQSKAARLAAAAEFQKCLEPIWKAMLAEETSRKIALAELRAAIREGLVYLSEDFAAPDAEALSTNRFMSMVNPWLDRLQS